MPKPPRRRDSKMTSEDEGRDAVPGRTDRDVAAGNTGTGDSTAADLAAAHAEDVEDAIEDVAKAININTYVDEVMALRAEMVEMRQLLATVAGLDLLSRSLQHGFGALGEQVEALGIKLEPLRNLVPPSNVGELDDDDTPERIETLRVSLRREDLSSIDKLAVPFTNVGFIGASSTTGSGKGEAR
jgi:hypothetical protein